MLLVVDIGNTTVQAALCSQQAILRQDRFVTRTRGDLGAFLDSFTRRSLGEIAVVGVSSVEPRTLEAFRDWARVLEVPIRVVGEDVPVPLDHSYADPARLGVDRLVDAHIVLERFGGDWVVVNAGTAVTVDAVSRKRVFHSGAILPGIWLSLESLSSGAARLPGIERLDRARFPTRSTEEAMVSGIMVGMAGMVDRIAESLAQAADIPVRAIATGGDAGRIAPHSRVIQEVVPGLTLLGILDLVRAPAD